MRRCGRAQVGALPAAKRSNHLLNSPPFMSFLIGPKCTGRRGRRCMRRASTIGRRAHLYLPLAEGGKLSARRAQRRLSFLRRARMEMPRM